MRLAIGPIVSIMYRAIYQTIKLAHTWYSSIKLEEFFRFEVQWWLNNLKDFSKYPIIIDSTTVKVDSGFFVVNLDKHIKLKSAPFPNLTQPSLLLGESFLPFINLIQMNPFVSGLRGLLSDTILTASQ